MAFEWANEDSRTFLSRGYIDGNMTVEERVREIAKTAEKILDKEGFAEVISGKKKLCTKFDEVCEKVDKIFPSMISVLKSYYKKKGRILSNSDYRKICVCRLRMMFKIQIKNK